MLVLRITDPPLHRSTLRGCTFASPFLPFRIPSSRFSPRRCTHGRWMQPSDRRTKSRWSDFKSINDGFALNLQSALIRITRYPATNCVRERFNENILIDVTRLPESPDSLEIWLKRPAMVEIAFRSSYKHDCMHPLSLQSVYLYRLSKF